MQLKMNDYEIKEVMKIIREWSEQSQKDFAKAVEKSYGAIIKYENGQRQASLETFVEICNKNNVQIILKKKTHKKNSRLKN